MKRVWSAEDITPGLCIYIGDFNPPYVIHALHERATVKNLRASGEPSVNILREAADAPIGEGADGTARTFLLASDHRKSYKYTAMGPLTKMSLASFLTAVNASPCET